MNPPVEYLIESNNLPAERIAQLAMKYFPTHPAPIPKAGADGRVLRPIESAMGETLVVDRGAKFAMNMSKGLSGKVLGDWALTSYISTGHFWKSGMLADYFHGLPATDIDQLEKTILGNFEQSLPELTNLSYTITPHPLSIAMWALDEFLRLLEAQGKREHTSEALAALVARVDRDTIITLGKTYLTEHGQDTWQRMLWQVVSLTDVPPVDVEKELENFMEDKDTPECEPYDDLQETMIYGLYETLTGVEYVDETDI